MREIKYKAYLKEEKKLCLVSNINFENRTAYLLGATPKTVENTVIQIGSAIIKQTIPTDGRACSFEEIELMQYTGLKDKNGKEIWEGDFVCPFNQEKETVNRALIVRMSKQNSFYNFYAQGTHRVFEQSFLPDYYIVIGNIYENPELLK